MATEATGPEATAFCGAFLPFLFNSGDAAKARPAAITPATTTAKRIETLPIGFKLDIISAPILFDAGL
jgi:hypothetical protein